MCETGTKDIYAYICVYTFVYIYIYVYTYIYEYVFVYMAREYVKLARKMVCVYV